MFNAEFTGNIVAEPSHGVAHTSGNRLLEFPVYINHAKKDKTTGEYVKTGQVSKIRVTVWGDLADNLDIHKGDLVTVKAGLVENKWENSDGSTGRSLQTTYVDSVVVKFKKDTPLEAEQYNPETGAYNPEPVEWSAADETVPF